MDHTSPQTTQRIVLGEGAWLDLWKQALPDAPVATRRDATQDDAPRASTTQDGAGAQGAAGTGPTPDVAWLRALCGELPLASETYHIAGREVRSPRLVAWHGDPEAAYTYSGSLHRPAPWTPRLRALRARVEALTGLRFNGMLANLYRDGRDGMGWHSDAEPAIGPHEGDRWIASLSLGAPRRFVLRHRQTRTEHVFTLGHGDLLVMRGTTQTHWRHALPKTRKPVGARLNLTFRHIIGASAATANVPQAPLPE